eukprot:TRINITY_DN5226_c0_g1_i1.p1 TRINITY_DN5226_c0_g1~~TRINITY_DN5226_c0_g1_i1.p1  ORF type:complete len:330 (-),score=52.92 TRINITY_DN5226_c0_g1_i1:15-1004(-)
MSNVRTLRDLEANNGPTSTAFPDPWKQQARAQQYQTRETSGLHQGGGFQFQYQGIDGTKKIGTSHQVGGPNYAQMCGLMCCPCCVPPLCSPEKQQEWFNFFKSFSFVISAVQFILLMVAFGIGGFASPHDNPSLGPPSSALITLGAKVSPLMKSGQVWRFITPIFLHAGLIHIFFNVFAQLRFGMALERRWGLIKYVALYFVSGIGGVLMSCLIRYNTLSVGASGAIMGLMGGYLAEIIMTWHKTDPRLRQTSLIQLVFVIVITMVISASPYIDAGAHFGGVVVGYLMGNLYFAVDHQSAAVRKIAIVISAILMLAFFVVGFAVFYVVM